MKFILLFLIPFLLYSQPNPIDITLQKVSTNKYQFHIILSKGYALQKDAPNKIQLTTENGLQITQFKSEFKGRVFLDKPEYFEVVEPIPLEVRGKGDIQIDAKLFYCDLSKGICYPGKISKKEKIQ